MTGMQPGGVVLVCAILALVAGSDFEAAESEQLSFVVLGDWGGLPFWPYETDGQDRVARRMGETASKINSSFTLALGDNFYFQGVENVEDKRFKETFEVRRKKHLRK